MLKRFFDIMICIPLLLTFIPIIIIFSIFVFFQDFHNPIYLAKRVGVNQKIITVYKIRSMRINTNNHNFNSTSDNDNRITKIGKIIRKIKLDEITQLINVLIGNLSLVGPRPNVFEDVNKYTDKEKHILSVLPGITDFSSIVFSDEGSILKNSKNPDLDYDILIRPWKSRLALLYIKNSNLILDIKILFFTFTNFFMRNRTLSMINTQLIKLTNDKELLEVCLRKKSLYPHTPPN
jgi:lipopolysaccharide/colanic/teichoic acid biosynthesis glycosyltransferase